MKFTSQTYNYLLSKIQLTAPSVKSWVTSNFVPYTGATSNVDLGNYGLKCNYLKFQTIANSTPSSFLALDSTSIACYRTAAQMLTDIGAASSASLANYLPLVGGTLTGNLNGVTPTEISRLSGVTSSIQNQINNLMLGVGGWKKAARVLVSMNVNISSPGSILDSTTMVSGDRVVLNGQSTASQNGVYVWNGSSSAMTRATDCVLGDNSPTGVLGMAITIEEGTCADQIWVLTNNAPIVVGTTALSFSMGSGTTYTSNNGVAQSGNNFSVDYSWFTGDVTVNSSGGMSIGAGKVTNAMLAGGIANSKLSNSTISGMALGSNLNALTISTGLSGTSYNGSGPITISIDSTVATLTDVQTLTNKTLTSPVLNVGSDATGDIYYRNASGVLTRLAIGTTGQGLIVAAGIPSWGTIATTLTSTQVGFGNGSNQMTSSASLTWDNSNTALQVGGATTYAKLNQLASSTGALTSTSGLSFKYGGSLNSGYRYQIWGVNLGSSVGTDNSLMYTGETNGSGSHRYCFTIGNGSGVPTTRAWGIDYNWVSGGNTFGFTGLQVFVGGVTAPTEQLEVGGNTKTNHIVGRTAAPTIAAGTGAGTLPTVSMTRATDMAGKINITTGTSPTASAIVATITFNAAYGAAPIVILTPANAAAAALTGNAAVYIDDSNTTTALFKLSIGSTNLSASTAYQFYYHIIQ